jgi:hypothetical protein
LGERDRTGAAKKARRLENGRADPEASKDLAPWSDVPGFKHVGENA